MIAACRQRYTNNIVNKPDIRLVCKYNVVDDTVNTKIFNENYLSSVFSVEIDGVKQTIINNEYPLSSGQHVIKFILTNMVHLLSNIFLNVTALTECYFYESFVSTGTNTFTGSGLLKVYIPKSIKTIQNYSFDTRSLEGVYIEDIASWCRIDFRYNNVGTNPLNRAHHLYLNNVEIIDVVVPEGITSLEKTFLGAWYITSVSLPTTITKIGIRAFCDCGSLTTVNIPEGVTNIRDMAFDGTKLSTITIPSTINTIDNYAFRGNNTLSSITCLATVPPSIGEQTFFNTGSCPIYVPAASVNDYLTQWGQIHYDGLNFANRITAIPT